METFDQIRAEISKALEMVKNSDDEVPHDLESFYHICTSMAYLDGHLQLAHVDDCYDRMPNFQKDIRSLIEHIGDNLENLKFNELTEKFKSLNDAPVWKIEKFVAKALLQNIQRRFQEIKALNECTEKIIGDLVDFPVNEFFSIGKNTTGMEINTYRHITEYINEFDLSADFYSMKTFMQSMKESTQSVNQWGVIILVDCMNIQMPDLEKLLSRPKTHEFLRIFDMKLSDYQNQTIFTYDVINRALMFIVNVIDTILTDIKNSPLTIYQLSDQAPIYNILLGQCASLLNKLPAKVLIIEQPGQIPNFLNDIQILIQNLCTYWTPTDGNWQHFVNINKKIHVYIQMWTIMKTVEGEFTTRHHDTMSQDNLPMYLLRTYNALNFHGTKEASQTYDIEYAQNISIRLSVLVKNTSSFLMQPKDDLQLLSTLALEEWSAKTKLYDTIQSVIDGSPTSQCTICLQNLSDNKNSIALLSKCRHIFCLGCIDKWFSTIGNECDRDLR